MNVVIWVLRKDVMTNNITVFHVSDTEFKYTCDPKEYVQIVMPRDEFIRLEDTLTYPN
jgi:hypothetical protein